MLHAERESRALQYPECPGCLSPPAVSVPVRKGQHFRGMPVDTSILGSMNSSRGILQQGPLVPPRPQLQTFLYLR